ncbi:MAG: DUF479 domain-containing protein [Flavobacterium sp.]|nr:DUF479 domain-containing protein [Flavobacterium sp.]
MNFLAHIYLSGNDDFIKIGNFMADGIRGKDYLNFSEQIKKGILLHRQIDTFTDAHPIFRTSKHRLHQNYGHYSGVIIDIFYDHFLAKNWKTYSSVNLDDYTKNFYNLIEQHDTFLTLRAKNMMPHMIKNNWLLSYQTISGIEKILIQMDYRTQNLSKMRFSVAELKLYYNEFETEFSLFFAEIIEFCDLKMKQL